MQGGWSRLGSKMSFVHEIEHTHSINHHHKQDGSIHHDDSTEVIQHIADHICCQQAVVLPAAEVIPSSIVFSIQRYGDVRSKVLDRFLECPQRPPSHLFS